jgi:hypothetical protein
MLSVITLSIRCQRGSGSRPDRCRAAGRRAAGLGTSGAGLPKQRRYPSQIALWWRLRRHGEPDRGGGQGEPVSSDSAAHDHCPSNVRRICRNHPVVCTRHINVAWMSEWLFGAIQREQFNLGRNAPYNYERWWQPIHPRRWLLHWEWPTVLRMASGLVSDDPIQRKYA